jgi:non-heme chloroperoxidase
MLPAEPNLEVRSRVPARAAGNGNRKNPKPPLLFIHGGYCDSWCWEPYFLPWFAALGYASHAVSLRGHGASGGRESLFVAGLDDFASDVASTADKLDGSPVLIGHSMGAAVVERLLATHDVRAAALLAPVPPLGLMSIATRLAAERPDYLMRMGELNGGASRLNSRVLGALHPFYFSDDVAPEVLAEVPRHIHVESPRALLDLSLRLNWQAGPRRRAPLLVLGAEGDRICAPDDVRATATHYGVTCEILPGLAHMLMLERQWERAARKLAAWLAEL